MLRAAAFWALGAGLALAEPLPRTEDEAARIAAVLTAPRDPDAPEAYQDHPGGRATTGLPRLDQPVPGLGEGRMDFALGKALFDKLWVAAPTTTKASDGLGPMFNARACAACHEGAGRGRDEADLVLRLSRPDGSPDPVLGSQLQTHAVTGMAPEGRIVASAAETDVALNGETVVLTAPTYRPVPDAGLILSARMAPALTGLGLVEAIPEADLAAHADPGDADGDGISGRLAVLEDGRIGRFGWKAASPSLRAQAAQAFSADMGLSTPDLPDPAGDCPTAACRAAPNGEDPGLRDGAEVDGASLDLVAFYLRNLAVPAPRGTARAEVLRGREVFHAAGCPVCHVPKFVTSRLAPETPQSFQLIWPYSDFLLHDMGPGLADGRPEGAASGSEWRTPPLWGIGLATGPSSRYLHDGRAHSLLEAVLWHGGEAKPARTHVAGLAKADRDALIAFLESL